ncbi:hypothetical protein ACJ41O_008203 [Fusarium nematophilum]
MKEIRSRSQTWEVLDEALEKDSWGWVREGCFVDSLHWGFANGRQRVLATANVVRGSWIDREVPDEGQETVIEVQGSSSGQEEVPGNVRGIEDEILGSSGGPHDQAGPWDGP